MTSTLKSTAVYSMTGFATKSGAFDSYAWTWDVRAVNGKGLDLRLRLPEWIEGLEADLRSKLPKFVKRGNVNVSLRVSREESATRFQVNQTHVAEITNAFAKIEKVAAANGVTLRPPSVSEIAAMRGVLDQSSADIDSTPLKAALLQHVEGVLSDFSEMRASEGARLSEVLRKQLAEIDRLVHQAEDLAEARKDVAAQGLRRNLSRILENTDEVDESRIAQELALMAIKSDVSEEIERLRAHVLAAEGLLNNGGQIGRKLDFLMQEFNREANTLCSKAQDPALTQIGLDLKIVIDQMREQVQNVE